METELKSAKKVFSSIGLILLLGTLIIYVVQYAAKFLFSKIPAVAGNGSLSFLCGMLPMYVIAFPIIFLLFKKVPVTITGEKKKMRVSHIIIFFMMCYAGTYICNLAASIITAIIGMLRQSAVDNVMLNVVTTINPVVNLFVVVFCAPIMEELLFRKTIIDRTAKYGEGMSIVFSGLLFGLFHGNLVQFGYAFLLGVCFGFIYIKTKNIIYPIILHMITNFLGSFVGAFILEKSGYMATMEKIATITDEAEMMNVMMENIGGLAIIGIYAMCLIGVVIAGIVLFFVNLKKFRLSPGEVTIEKGKRFSVMILNVGIILYCIFWIGQIILQLFA